jgi:hypothetical protein
MNLKKINKVLLASLVAVALSSPVWAADVAIHGDVDVDLSMINSTVTTKSINQGAIKAAAEAITTAAKAGVTDFTALNKALDAAMTETSVETKEAKNTSEAEGTLKFQAGETKDSGSFVKVETEVDFETKNTKSAAKVDEAWVQFGNKGWDVTVGQFDSYYYVPVDIDTTIAWEALSATIEPMYLDGIVREGTQTSIEVNFNISDGLKAGVGIPWYNDGTYSYGLGSFRPGVEYVGGPLTVVAALELVNPTAVDPETDSTNTSTGFGLGVRYGISDTINIGVSLVSGSGTEETVTKTDTTYTDATGEEQKTELVDKSKDEGTGSTIMLSAGVGVGAGTIGFEFWSMSGSVKTTGEDQSLKAGTTVGEIETTAMSEVQNDAASTAIAIHYEQPLESGVVLSGGFGTSSGTRETKDYKTTGGDSVEASSTRLSFTALYKF